MKEVKKIPIWLGSPREDGGFDCPIIISIENLTDREISNVKIINRFLDLQSELKYSSLAIDATYSDYIKFFIVNEDDAKFNCRSTIFISPDSDGDDKTDELTFDFKIKQNDTGDEFVEKITIDPIQEQKDRAVCGLKYKIMSGTDLIISRLKPNQKIDVRIYLKIINPQKSSGKKCAIGCVRKMDTLATNYYISSKNLNDFRITLDPEDAIDFINDTEARSKILFLRKKYPDFDFGLIEINLMDGYLK